MRNSNFSCKNEQLSAICKHTSVDRYRITILTLIYTDGCETWGAFLSTKDKIFNINHEKYSLFDEPCFEKLDIKYLKTCWVSIESPAMLWLEGNLVDTRLPYIL